MSLTLAEATIETGCSRSSQVAFGDRGALSAKPLEACLQVDWNHYYDPAPTLEKQVDGGGTKAAVERKGVWWKPHSIICIIEHTRHHRLLTCWWTPILALCAYTALDRKPSSLCEQRTHIIYTEFVWITGACYRLSFFKGRTDSIYAFVNTCPRRFIDGRGIWCVGTCMDQLLHEDRGRGVLHGRTPPFFDFWRKYNSRNWFYKTSVPSSKRNFCLHSSQSIR